MDNFQECKFTLDEYSVQGVLLILETNVLYKEILEEQGV